MADAEREPAGEDAAEREVPHRNKGSSLRMVDVGSKPVTAREAVASGRIVLSEKAARAVLERTLPKGDVITAAELAGIQAAKCVWELVPLCHPLPIDKAAVTIAPTEGGGEITRRPARASRWRRWPRSRRLRSRSTT